MRSQISSVVVAITLLCGIAAAQPASVRVLTDGVKSEVTVRRDGRGIPHIEARSDSDLYFAQGYVTASDRLWQMDLMRRVARGETAEVLGNVTLEEDKRWRRFGFALVAEQAVREMSPDVRAALDDYARGVNAFIATLDDKTLPVEFKILQYKPKRWQSTDTIVIGKILADGLSTTWRNDLLRASLSSLPKDKFADLTNQVTPYDVVLFGKDTVDAKTAATAEIPAIGDDFYSFAEIDEHTRAESLGRIGFYAEGLAASNNWVISGKRTADGKPLLANDPHLAPTAPGIWYMCELTSPTVHAAGVTVPGGPGVTLGHNGSIAWGATNVGPDVQDIYVETFNDSGEYKTPAGWEKPVIRKETINVRVSPVQTETAAVTIDVTETRHGPIIFEEGGKRYALRWTAFNPKNSEFDGFFQINRATNWEQFKTALGRYGGPMQNFVYADVKGNIGWYAAGRVPIRKVGDGSMPYDGSLSDGDWVGMIPFDELPNLYNPPDGLIVTANQRIVGTTYKYRQLARDVATPWRARRILDELSARTRVTMDDARDVQYDTYNIPLHQLAKTIVKLGAASADTLAVLKDWDGKMLPDSRGAVLANEIRICVGNQLADENKPAPAYIIRERVVDRAIAENLTRWLPAGVRSYAELLSSCDVSSRAALSAPARLGPDPTTWTWGRTFQSRLTHPLSIIPFVGGQFATPVVPLGGSGQTPNVGSYVSMRLIASPGNWDATRHVIPLGISGDFTSADSRDQFDSWRTGTPVVFPFSPAAVAAATTQIMVLSLR